MVVPAQGAVRLLLATPERRQRLALPPGPQGESPAWGSEASAALLADVLVDGISPAIANRLAGRVADYLGTEWERLLPRRWSARDCRLLAQTARAVLDLKKSAHKAVGEAVSELLPAGTSSFRRMLVRKIAEKVPLPWDAHVEATARGLLVIGIYLCLLHNRPLERCPCMQMLAPQLVTEHLEQEIKELLDETWRDLKRARGSPA
jgi:hypothetical protein